MANDDLCFTMPSFLTQWNITVNSNTAFKIRIEGNPTTGYIWYISNVNDINQQLLLITNINSNNTTEDYAINQQYDGIVGQPGYYIFEFEAKKPTLTDRPIRIEFIEKRPWEKEPIETVTVFIAIVN